MHQIKAEILYKEIDWLPVLKSLLLLWSFKEIITKCFKGTLWDFFLGNKNFKQLRFYFICISIFLFVFLETRIIWYKNYSIIILVFVQFRKMPHANEIFWNWRLNWLWSLACWPVRQSLVEDIAGAHKTPFHETLRQPFWCPPFPHKYKYHIIPLPHFLPPFTQIYLFQRQP